MRSFFQNHPHGTDHGSFDLADLEAKVERAKQAGTTSSLADALLELSTSTSAHMQRLHLRTERDKAYQTIRNDDDTSARLRKERLCELYASIDLTATDKQKLATHCLQIVEIFEHLVKTTAPGALAGEQVGGMLEGLDQWMQSLRTKLEVRSVVGKGAKVRGIDSLSQEPALDMARSLKRRRIEHETSAHKVLEKWRNFMAKTTAEIDDCQENPVKTVEKIVREFDTFADEHRQMKDDGDKLNTQLRVMVGKTAAESREANTELLSRLRAGGVGEEHEAKVARVCKALEAALLEFEMDPGASALVAQTERKQHMEERRSVMHADVLEVVCVTMRQAGESALAEVMLGSQVGDRVQKAGMVHVDALNGFEDATQVYPSLSEEGDVPEAQQGY